MLEKAVLLENQNTANSAFNGGKPKKDGPPTMREIYVTKLIDSDNKEITLKSDLIAFEHLHPSRRSLKCTDLRQWNSTPNLCSSKSTVPCQMSLRRSRRSHSVTSRNVPEIFSKHRCLSAPPCLSVKAKKCEKRLQNLPTPRHRSCSPTSSKTGFYKIDSLQFPEVLALMPSAYDMCKDGIGKSRSNTTNPLCEGSMADVLLYGLSHERARGRKCLHAEEIVRNRVPKLTAKMHTAFSDVITNGRSASSWPLVWEAALGYKNGKLVQPAPHPLLSKYKIRVVNPLEDGFGALEELGEFDGPLFVDTEDLYHGDQGPERKFKVKDKVAFEKIALIQISDNNRKEVLLVRVHQMSLTQLEELHLKMVKIAERRTFYSFGETKNIGANVINIQPKSTEKGKENDKKSLAWCSAMYLDGMVVEKTEQLSNWAAPRLRASQVQYAALDAVLVGELYLRMPGNQW